MGDSKDKKAKTPDHGGRVIEHKTSQAEIDRILDKAIERESKYFRFPDRPTGGNGRAP